MAEASPAAAIGTADFAEIVREHQSMVFSIAYHFLHDRPAAEEIAQDVFLQLYKSLPGLESNAHVLFWLRKVTTHRSIDSARRRKLHPSVDLESIPEPSTPASAWDPIRAARLRKLVASLPEKARMLVVLRYQEEMEPEEIAKIMEIPVGTVKSGLQRALAMLRDKIGRTWGEARI